MNNLSGPLLKRVRHAGRRALPHGVVTRAFHWLGVVLLAYAFVRNGEVTNAVFDAAAMRREVASGAAIGAFFLARWLWVRFHGGSRLPVDAPRWERRLSRIAHASLYGLLAYVVLTGLAIGWLRPGARIDPVATFFASDDPMLNFVLDTHAAAANLLLLLIGLHVGAALWHLLIRRDGVWQAMTGSLRGRTTKGRPNRPI